MFVTHDHLFFTDAFVLSPDEHHTQDQNTAYMLEAQALRSEMKHCTEQVEKLSREFNEIKKDIEAARKEVDTTRSTLTEITMKLLSTY